MKTKRCGRCKEDKTVDQFYVQHASKLHGTPEQYSTYCRECARAARKEYYKKKKR